MHVTFSWVFFLNSTAFSADIMVCTAPRSSWNFHSLVLYKLSFSSKINLNLSVTLLVNRFGPSSKLSTLSRSSLSEMDQNRARSSVEFLMWSRVLWFSHHVLGLRIIIINCSLAVQNNNLHD